MFTALLLATIANAAKATHRIGSMITGPTNGTLKPEMP